MALGFYFPSFTGSPQHTCAKFHTQTIICVTLIISKNNQTSKEAETRLGKDRAAQLRSALPTPKRLLSSSRSFPATLPS